jgi:hypothetical protein
VWALPLYCVTEWRLLLTDVRFPFLILSGNTKFTYMLIERSPTDLSHLIGYEYVFFNISVMYIIKMLFLSVVLTRHAICKMHLIITILIMNIIYRLINNNFYVSPSLNKSHITSPANCLYWVLYMRSSPLNVKAVSWGGDCCIMCVSE